MTTNEKLKLLNRSYNIKRFHIVPVNTSKSKKARDIMKRFDIGLESLNNILPLNSIPSELKSNHYYDFINTSLNSVKSETELKQKLKEISNLITTKSLPCFIMKES